MTAPFFTLFVDALALFSYAVFVNSVFFLFFPKRSGFLSYLQNKGNEQRMTALFFTLFVSALALFSYAVFVNSVFFLFFPKRSGFLSYLQNRGNEQYTRPLTPSNLDGELVTTANGE